MRARVGATQMLLLLLLAGGYAGAAGAVTGDPVAGKQKAATCAGCHGTVNWRNAYPAYHVPKLGGQHADYLVAALKAYQTKQRAHPTMQAITATMSEQDMADLAAYFAAAGAEAAR